MSLNLPRVAALLRALADELEAGGSEAQLGELAGVVSRPKRQAHSHKAAKARACAGAATPEQVERARTAARRRGLLVAP